MFKLVVVTCALLVAVAVAGVAPGSRGASGPVITPDTVRRFTRWAQQYKRTYSPKEYQKRLVVFAGNMELINTHNAKNTTFTMAMNQFGDLTTQEYRAFMLGVRYDDTSFNRTLVQPSKPMALPATWDWRQQGAVTPIKNQQQCGSCWAFSTTGSTEGCHKLSGKPLVSVSEQNLMDCSSAQGNQACDGGLMTQAMTYIISNGGIDTEASYPYTAEDGPTCNYVAANSGATLKSYTNVVQYSESDLQLKCSVGPVSVAIDASHSSFQFYSSGVYNEPDCSEDSLDHGVLAIGWGTYQSTAYWLVKNSWGTSWGLSGFIMMSRNLNNQCGIATMATLPVC